MLILSEEEMEAIIASCMTTRERMFGCDGLQNRAAHAIAEAMSERQQSTGGTTNDADDWRKVKVDE